MSELPWWGWMLLVSGGVAVVTVIGALFLPDFPAPDLECESEAPVATEAFLAVVSNSLNVPVIRGGECAILQNGDVFFPAILEAIRSAQHTVNFQVYIFEPKAIGEKFIQAFKERARAGVEVRILIDAFGSWRLRKSHRRALEEAGCRVELFRPIRVHTLVRAFRRDHRRAIVVDGRVAFTGGAAVADKWCGHAQDPEHWRDSMVQFTGPLAAAVQTAFGASWAYCTGEIIAGPRFYPYSSERAEVEAGAADRPAAVAVVSSPADSSQPVRPFFWLSFKAARTKIYMSSSYFIPGMRIRAIVMERARAGVDVRILVPGRHTDAKPVRLAGRAHYEELLEAGVRIFEYSPSMMHAKTVVVDGVWSIAGSSNMDERSMELNEENCVGVADHSLAADIEQGLLADMEQAEEVDLEHWRKRSALERALERFARVLIEQY